MMGREGQGLPGSWLGNIPQDKTHGTRDMCFGKDDELSYGSGEAEVPREHVCNGFFFPFFIHSLFIEHLLCARHSRMLISWSCPSRRAFRTLFLVLNPDLLNFHPLVFYCPSGLRRSVPHFRD